MNTRDFYTQMAQQAGLALDAASGTIYGKRDGYEVTVFAPNAAYPNRLQIRFTVQRQSGPLSAQEIREFRGANKAAAKIEQNGRILTITPKNAVSQKKTAENVLQTLDALTAFLRAHGFFNVCQMCGRPGPAEACFADGSVVHLCPACFAQMEQNKTMEEIDKANKKENVVAGAVGALLGSLVGVLCIVVLSRLGYVAALSGLVMAVCALKGYELLGGKLTKKGVVISSILMLVMTFVGDRIDWAIIIAGELGSDFFTSFRAVSFLLDEGIIDSGTYWGNLAMLYLFLLLGAVPTILGALKKRRMAGHVYHMGDSSAPVQM